MSAAELISLGSAVAVFLLGWIAIVCIQALRRRATIRQRMDPIVGLLAVESPESRPKRVRERKTAMESTIIARLDARYPLAGGVRTTIIAGVTGLLTITSLVPAIDFFGLSGVFAYVVAAIVAASLGLNVGNVLEESRRSEFRDRFLIALEDFHRMVRYGIASNQALTSITAATAEPVKRSLRNIVLETEFGVPIGTAMEREAHRIRISELSMLAAVVSTQSSTGGNLSESVGNLAATLRERLDNRSRMRAATAESRVTLLILAFVPVAGIGLQAVMQPELIDLLLGEARHLFGIGMLLIVAGLLMAWKMIRSAQR